MTRKSGEHPKYPFSFDYEFDTQDTLDAASFAHDKVLTPFAERTGEARDTCIIIGDQGKFHREATELLYKPNRKSRKTVVQSVPEPDVLSLPDAHLCIHPGSPKKSMFASPGVIGEYISERVPKEGWGRATDRKSVV